MFGRLSWIGVPLALTVAGWSLAAGAQTQTEFEVREGYLSSGVRDLVEQHGWSLVWKAKEDRMVEFPFSIRTPGGSSEEGLRESLENLLESYQGAFVADMYRANKVVTVDSAPPNLRPVRALPRPSVASGQGQTTAEDTPANSETEAAAGSGEE